MRRADLSITRQCVIRTRRWPLRRDDSSRVRIGADGTCVLIGQSACRLLTGAREAIDSTRAGARGSLHSATTNSGAGRKVHTVVGLTSGVGKVTFTYPSVRGNPLAIGLSGP